MTHPFRGRRVVVVLATLALAGWESLAARHVAAQAETKTASIVNGGIEEQDARGRPVGWLFPAVLEQAGYRTQVVTDNPHVGEKCVLLDATGAEESGGKFGNLMQSLDATSYRGKRVRFRAAVRTSELSSEGRAQLWFRVEIGRAHV